MMKFSQKFAYMVLGGLLVFMGQLLPNMLSEHATAQSDESAEFDEVKCRRLEVVNASGRTLAILDASSAGDVLRILDNDGKPAVAIGQTGITVGTKNRGNTLIQAERVTVSGTWGQASIGSSRGNRGTIVIEDRSTNSGVQIGIEDLGGDVAILDRRGQVAARMTVSKFGGTVYTGERR